MSSAEILPAPDVELPVERGESKWKREYEAFQRKLPELLKQYEGQYVAIHDGEAVAAGDDEVAVIQAAYDRVGYTAMHVGKVSLEPPRVYRLPSPRIPRNLTSG